jgi:hypothetical protein
VGWNEGGYVDFGLKLSPYEAHEEARPVAAAAMGTPNAILRRVAGRPTKMVLHAPPKSRAPSTLDVTGSSGEGRPLHRGPPPPGNVFGDGVFKKWEGGCC